MILRALVVCLASVALLAPAASAAPSFDSGHGLTVGKVERISARQFDVALRSSVIVAQLSTARPSARREERTTGSGTFTSRRRRP